MFLCIRSWLRFHIIHACLGAHVDDGSLLSCFVLFIVHACFGECRGCTNILQCVVLEEQTPQLTDGALASCYNHVCTKTLHIDIISIEGGCIRLESCQAKTG